MNFTQLLEKIKNDEVVDLNGHEKEQLLSFMLEHIGSVDEYIRDTLIYNSFSYLILNSHLTEDELFLLTETIISHDYLLYNVGSYIQSDDVFKRSFSCLVLVLCIMQQQKQPFLSASLIQKVEKAIKQYLINETDYRGYVSTKGWAHSVAHSADLLHTVLAQSNQFSTFTFAFAKTILQKWLLQPVPFIDDEHERMANVIVAMLANGWTTNELSEWILLLRQTEVGNDYTQYRILWNVEKFVCALFLKCKDDAVLNSLLKSYL